MKSLRTCSVVAALGVAALAGGPARAELILKLDGTTCSGCTDATNTVVSWNGASIVNGWKINAAVGEGINTFGNTGEFFDLSNLEAKSMNGKSTLTVALTETNLSAAALDNFMAVFAENDNKVKESSSIYIDTNNTPFGTQDLIGSTDASGNFQFNKIEGLTGLFSITEIDTFTATVKGAGVSDDDNLSVFAVPEPGSLALLGAGIIALGGAWRRRNKAA